MIIHCATCFYFYDDEFRNTGCPHTTFMANDGQNNFKEYSESWYSVNEPPKHYIIPKVKE